MCGVVGVVWCGGDVCGLVWCCWCSGDLCGVELWCFILVWFGVVWHGDMCGVV